MSGTGNINLMIHLRGHKHDFDNWANLTGDPEWSWEGVLPYFKSYEDYQDLGDEVNHGYKGELRIERPDYIGLAPEFVRGAEELGYPNVDLNAPYSEGFDVIQYPIKRGVRQATYKAFIEPVRYQTLTILKYSHVNKILFKDNVAVGVSFDRHGVPKTAYASKEVIISAGTVGTPKLLMLSGVGPREHLEELNTSLHIAVYSALLDAGATSTFLDRDITPSSFVKWFTTGRGQLSSTGCEASGLISSEFAKARGEGSWPDIHLFLYSFTFKRDELTKYYQNNIGTDASHVIVSGARPYSRGYIKLGGSSAYDKPIIDPRYLSDPGDLDLKVLLEGVKKSLLLMENTTAFGELGVRFTDVKLPGCEHLEFRTDPYWECFIRRYSITLHHPVGTAAMGSVVDTDLRVIGTKNLRVMDSSIQPVIVTTNTQASAIMIGEKGSHMLIKYWKKIQLEEQKIYQKAVLKKSKWNKLELVT
ncbi:Glucose dehydrogenase [FAD, quinone] [Orchesella cincta]|uniref:Glucose dehydrogenase [FAD, quinone] n=1 Tax=Orchesella cincta TaxID=48709 RepID=A0A1D2M978_ORCCI|nr:Glucose dehydrogenase [FAD, quinone] [Orchesella cincta]